MEQGIKGGPHGGRYAAVAGNKVRVGVTQDCSPCGSAEVPFHILGSKLNSAGSENCRSLKSECGGLMSKLNPSGITADGAKRQTDEAETSQRSPTAQSSSGNGTPRHDLGSAATLTCSYLIPSGIDMRMDTRSAGASSGSRFTKYSRDAKARLADAYATRHPDGVHLPPRRLEPSPSNAAAGGFA